MSLFISEQRTSWREGSKLFNCYASILQLSPESDLSGVRVIVSRGGHKYSKVGSKGKRCPIKLAFLFHMNDFRSPTEPVQDNGNYEGAKIYCLQKLKPEQWQSCDTSASSGQQTTSNHASVL